MTRLHFLDGDADLDKVLADTAAALRAAPVDVAFVGIGENGHLASVTHESDYFYGLLIPP